jgi:CRP-like cAMP-binding protein
VSHRPPEPGLEPEGERMFAEQIRRAVEASPRVELPKLSSALWKAFAAKGVSAEEAEALSELIEQRKKVPPPAPRLAQRRVGSRPRTPASMARRRSWAAAGRLPPQLAAQFTVAEQAVLSVVSLQVEQGGACVLTLEHLAALAGVCRSTVKNALRQAQQLGLIRVEERRLTAWRNAPNKVMILSPEWLTWMRLRSKRGGGKSVPPTSSQDLRRKRSLPESGLRRLPRASSPLAGSRQDSETSQRLEAAIANLGLMILGS